MPSYPWLYFILGITESQWRFLSVEQHSLIDVLWFHFSDNSENELVKGKMTNIRKSEATTPLGISSWDDSGLDDDASYRKGITLKRQFLDTQSYIVLPHHL